MNKCRKCGKRQAVSRLWKLCGQCFRMTEGKNLGRIGFICLIDTELSDVDGDLQTCCGRIRPEYSRDIEDIIPLWKVRDMLIPQIRTRIMRVSCPECLQTEIYSRLRWALGLQEAAS